MQSQLAGMKNGGGNQMGSSLDQSNSEVMGRNQEGMYILEENHSEQKLERELAHQLNKFRFKNGKIIQKLLSLIGGEGVLRLEESGREIRLENTQMVDKLRTYFHEIDIVNQILSDFTFNAKDNEEFVNEYKQQIMQNKLLSDSNSEKVKQRLQAKAHYSYYLKDVSLKNYDELIILLLIEEFIILNSQSRQNDTLSLDFSHAPQHLGLIDSLYNKIFIFIHEKTPSNSQQTSPNMPILYDVFILLIYDDNIETNQDLIKANAAKNVLHSSLNQPNATNTTQRTDRFGQARVPDKYKKLIKRSTQIPKLSIKSLVQQMDSDNDGRITVDDIRNFSHKKFIYFKPNVYQEMFDDVTKLRIVIYEDQRTAPLKVDEIWTAAQMHYKLGPEHIWIENPRPYRRYWVQLLQEAGERLPKHHDLPQPRIEAIKDQHQQLTQKTRNFNEKQSSSCVI